MMFSKSRQAILAVHERTSRLLLAVPIERKFAAGVAGHLVRLFKAVPEALRRTVTFDNGTEFAAHLSLQSLLMKTFFCDPHAPWQKGGIENAIGRYAPLHPPKDRPRKALNQALPPVHCRLQQHPAQMP